MGNRLRNFRIRDSLLLKALNHSYIRKRYSYFVSSMSAPSHLHWMTTEQAAWSAISRYICLPQFSQTCHNYSVFDNRVVCVCLFCVILFKQSELSGCMGCVNMLVTGRMCVYDGLHIAHLPLSVNCLLVSTHSYSEKKGEKNCLVCKYCILETVGDSELWLKPGKPRQEFFFDCSSCVFGLKWFASWKVVPDLMWELMFSVGVRKIRLSQWNRSIRWK
jgi:hypothetical protein